MSLREDAEEDPGSEQEIKRRMPVCMKEEGLRKSPGSQGGLGGHVGLREALGRM